MSLRYQDYCVGLDAVRRQVVTVDDAGVVY